MFAGPPIACFAPSRLTAALGREGAKCIECCAIQRLSSLYLELDPEVVTMVGGL